MCQFVAVAPLSLRNVVVGHIGMSPLNKASHPRALRALDLQTAARFVGRCWRR